MNDTKIYVNNIMVKNGIYTIREPNKLLEYINDNLTPKEKERKKSGEVFTPLYIVEEMLDKIPKKVWSDHTLKWLDPSVGIGNFPICIYIRLINSSLYKSLKFLELDKFASGKSISALG